MSQKKTNQNRKSQSKNPPKEGSLDNLEDKLQNSPVIQSIGQSMTTLAQGIDKMAQHTQENIETLNQEADKKNLENSEKISNLAKAVSVLNDEFTKFINLLKKPPPVASPTNPQPGNPATSPAEVIPEAENAPAKGDKFLEWARILSMLAGSGGGGGGDNSASIANTLKFIMDIQDKSEERALERQSSALSGQASLFKTFLDMGKFFSGKKIEISTPEEPEHLE